VGSSERDDLHQVHTDNIEQAQVGGVAWIGINKSAASSGNGCRR
jgi:hypothetical protein